MLQFNVVTLFPEMFSSITEQGVTSRALSDQLYGLELLNPRRFANNKYGNVDERPYGGGPGMVMMYEPLAQSVQSFERKGPVIYLSPQGQPLTQAKAVALSKLDAITLVCGRYEGLDQRFIDEFVDEEISIGDYVLSGGELGAMVLMDSVIRLLPGALGSHESAEQDSFSDGLLDCPHYTRPEKIGDDAVPDVLMSGNHAMIAKWRREQQLKNTWLKRPDLLESVKLSDEELNYLNDLRHKRESL